MDFGQLFAPSLLLHGPTRQGANVFFTIRLPRVLAALIVGAALLGAGCAFQGIFKNPMVSPDLLGASAGACFGAAAGILLSFGSFGIEIAAFAMGVLAVFVAMRCRASSAACMAACSCLCCRGSWWATSSRRSRRP